MRATLVVTLVIGTYSLAICSSELQQTKEVESRMAMKETGKSSDFDLMEIMSECNETFRIEMFFIEALNTSGSFPDETDKTPKCFIRCVLEKSAVTADGEEFDVERSAALWARVRPALAAAGAAGAGGGAGAGAGGEGGRLRDAAARCARRSESCKCEKSYQYLKCLMETEIEKHET